MDNEKKEVNNTKKIFLLDLIASAAILFLMKDEANISGIVDFILYAVGLSVGLFVVSGFATAIANVALQSFDGKERKIEDEAILSAMIVAAVAGFLILKPENSKAKDVAEKLPLYEVLEAYEEKDEIETYGQLFSFLKNNASDNYSDYEMIESLGIDPKEFAYDYVYDR